jgi:hypothetical protein
MPNLDDVAKEQHATAERLGVMTGEDCAVLDRFDGSTAVT